MVRIRNFDATLSRILNAGHLRPIIILTFFQLLGNAFSQFLANFERPVLGCIDANVCKQKLNARLRALDEI